MNEEKRKREKATSNHISIFFLSLTIDERNFCCSIAIVVIQIETICNDRYKVCLELIVKKQNSIIITRETNQLTNEQLQTVLNTDHIRQHLIKVGLVCIGKCFFPIEINEIIFIE